MLNDFSMPVAPRRDQHPVRHLPAIVSDRVPRKRGQPTIGFVHDQICGGKVPVVAVAAGKGDIEPRVRDPAQPQRERSYARMQRDVAQRLLQPLDQRLRAGDTGKSSSAPDVA